MKRKKVKIIDMKKSVILTVALFLSLLTRAQNGPVDEIFKKYSDRDGFSVVTISSRMLGLFAGSDNESGDADNIMRKLKSVKILSVSDSLLNLKLNFYTELSKKLDMSAYEELLAVKEGANVTKFLIKQNGDRISELLVVTGGPNGNSLIYIQGDMNLKNISDLSKSIDNQDIKKLDKLEKKNTE